MTTGNERAKKHYWELKADPVRYAAHLERKRKERMRRASTSTVERDRQYAWRAKNPERAKAIRTANNRVITAIRNGTLVRPAICSSCGAVGKIEAHHHKGYAPEFWLDVVWLCKSCHAKAPSFNAKLQHRKGLMKEELCRHEGCGQPVFKDNLGYWEHVNNIPFNHYAMPDRRKGERRKKDLGCRANRAVRYRHEAGPFCISQRQPSSDPRQASALIDWKKKAHDIGEAVRAKIGGGVYYEECEDAFRKGQDLTPSLSNLGEATQKDEK